MTVFPKRLNGKLMSKIKYKMNKSRNKSSIDKAIKVIVKSNKSPIKSELVANKYLFNNKIIE